MEDLVLVINSAATQMDRSTVVVGLATHYLDIHAMVQLLHTIINMHLVQLSSIDSQ